MPAPTPAPDRPGRRDDLDGLRGVAIALVVVFHLWVGRVSGGVDAFLVLTGFFAIGALWRGADQGAVAALRRIPRLVRRLLPSVVVVLVGTILISLVALPATVWRGVAAELVASIGFHQNWYLAAQGADYAAADAAVSPLQHLWSIAVQVQVVVAVALLTAGVIALARRLRIGPRRPLLAVLILATVVSFGYATLAPIPPDLRYYDTLARAWQPLVGGLLAIAPMPRLPRRLATPLAATALLALVGGGLVLDGARDYPGPLALVPVWATAALILTGGSAVAGLLAHRLPVALGRLAFGCYLWHWPLLIGWLAAGGRSGVGPVDGLAVIVVALALAVLTRRWVEQPRPLRRPLRWPVRRVLIGTLAVMVVVSGSVWQQVVTRSVQAAADELDPVAYPGAARLVEGREAPPAPVRPAVVAALDDVPVSERDGCIVDYQAVDAVRCSFGDPDGEVIVVAGSSHADHWLPALIPVLTERGYRVDTYLKMGCPLTTEPEPIREGDPYPECGAWSAQVLDLLAAEPPSAVITTVTRPRDDGPGDHVPTDYPAVWQRLTAAGSTVIGIRDTPWLYDDDGRPYRAPDCLATGRDPDSCGIPRAMVLDDVDPAEAARDALPAATRDRIALLDLSDAFCDGDICRAIEGNVVIYRDAHHLTATYVRTLVPVLDRRLGAATGWWDA